MTVDTGIQGSVKCGKRITANWGANANLCTKTGNKAMGVVNNRHHLVPQEELGVKEGRTTTRTLET